MVRLDDFLPGQDGGMLDDIAKFTNISGPRAAVQFPQATLRQPRSLGSHKSQEMLGQ